MFLWIYWSNSINHDHIQSTGLKRIFQLLESNAVTVLWIVIRDLQREFLQRSEEGMHWYPVSFLTLRLDEKFSSVICVMSQWPWLVWGYRVVTIYTKTHNLCFPPSSVLFTTLPTETTYQRIRGSGPFGESLHAILILGALLTNERRGFVGITATCH